MSSSHPYLNGPLQRRSCDELRKPRMHKVYAGGIWYMSYTEM
jgi:hypothetical protein